MIASGQSSYLVRSPGMSALRPMATELLRYTRSDVTEEKRMISHEQIVTVRFAPDFDRIVAASLVMMS